MNNTKALIETPDEMFCKAHAREFLLFLLSSLVYLIRGWVTERSYAITSTERGTYILNLKKQNVSSGGLTRGLSISHT